MATASIQPFNEKAAHVWSRGGHGYAIIAQQCLPGIVHAVDRLDPKRGELVLDVGTGTGRAARELAVRGASSTGVDIAEGMLSSARVLQSGDCLTVTAWTPDCNAGLMRQELASFAPPPPEPAPPAPWAWVTGEGLQEYLGADCDFEFKTGVLHLRHPDANPFWHTFAGVFGPVKAVADSLEAHHREALATALRRWAEAFRSAWGISIPCEHVLSVAHRR